MGNKHALGPFLFFFHTFPPRSAGFVFLVATVLTLVVDFDGFLCFRLISCLVLFFSAVFLKNYPEAFDAVFPRFLSGSGVKRFFAACQATLSSRPWC